MTDTATTAPATAELLEAYLDLWHATDEGTRAELLERVFTPDGRHVDPHADARGHDGLAEMLAGVHAAYPGFRIERTSGIDQHNDQVRFTWDLTLPDGTVLVQGTDVAELAPDGRLARVVGFWGDLPAR